jgi:crotonobetainyl-CoA:carnitine CoA-transferase CaiB-like acyl-CoA transferase
VRELAAPAYGSSATSRRREFKGGGAIVTVLPASDGHVVISPREDHQWQAWIGVLGSPAWASDPRFADRRSRMDNWQSLYPLMCDWSRQRSVREIYDACQSSRVPCFPFGTAADMLASPQLEHRGFFRSVQRPDARPLIVPGPPYGLPPEDYGSLVEADGAAASGGARTDWRPDAGAQPRDRAAAGGRERRLPLEGIRVLDFSWIIAGPTCTRYLAAMGAEVIKVESADRPDPGRASELHDILGQSKAGLALNLKAPGALDAAKALVARSDIVVENFAPGVMERLGLGYPALREVQPDVVLLSASGLGQTGPDANKVAYGALLQCFTGFATLNGFPGRLPASGMAWADPLCGLVLAFAAVAALRDRDATGRGRHIDFSMVEALLSTMPGPLLDYQIGGGAPGPRGNDDATHSPHGVFRCAGGDAWIAIAVTSDDEWRSLCGEVESLAALDALDAGERRKRSDEIDATLREWALPIDAGEAMHQLQSAGVPASASFSGSELFDDPHLRARGFYRAVTYADGAERVLPGLPWRWGNGSLFEPARAPALGGDTDRVLRDVLGLSEGEIEKLRTAGALS